MNRIFIAGLWGFSLVATACEKEKDPLAAEQEWLIPKSEVYDGGPGKDGIPALTRPLFIDADQEDYVEETDLVIGWVAGGEARAYPHHILDWHEIINDEMEDRHIVITYCPLTGTGIGWNRKLEGKVTTFGVSGLLFNSNLIPYDRETDSNWSQMRLDCVNGELQGTGVETMAIVETTWATWKSMYPETRVLSTQTDHNRSYGVYPYGSYRSNHGYLLFPVAHKDDRLNNKDRVHAIIRSGSARVYPLTHFGDRVTVIEEEVAGAPVVVAGNETDNFVVSFFRDPGDGTDLRFSAVQGDYPVILTDQEGNRWDVFGRAISGPREGTRLTHARSYMGYWFAFAAFFPGLSLYGE